MRIISIIITFLFIYACTGEVEEKPSVPPVDEIESSILKVNRYILKRNLDHIRGFVRRTGWDMKETGSGLFYTFQKEGEGDKAEVGQVVNLDYSLKLIDGSFINSSGQSGPMEFRIGQGGVPSGLEESVLLARTGSVMRLILPPHLSYGNFGNPEIGIPPDAILLYEISVNWIK